MGQTSAMNAADELAQHLLGDLQVGDHPVAERPAGRDRRRRAADHALGLVPDREHAAGLGVLGHDGGLRDGDPVPADVNQRVRGSEIDREVVSPAEAQTPSQGHSSPTR